MPIDNLCAVGQHNFSPIWQKGLIIVILCSNCGLTAKLNLAKMPESQMETITAVTQRGKKKD